MNRQLLKRRLLGPLCACLAFLLYSLYYVDTNIRTSTDIISKYINKDQDINKYFEDEKESKPMKKTEVKSRKRRKPSIFRKDFNKNYSSYKQTNISSQDYSKANKTTKLSTYLKTSNVISFNTSLQNSNFVNFKENASSKTEVKNQVNVNLQQSTIYKTNSQKDYNSPSGYPYPGYVYPNPTICPDSGKNVSVLALVPSAPGRTLRRQVIRETWGRPQPHGNTVVAFFLGRPANKSRMKVIQEEINQHGDIIVADFTDNYYNLTVKVLSLMKWTMTYCSKTEFLLKVDDDTFINQKNLYRYLRWNKDLGTIYGIRRKPTKPVSEKNSKWYIDKSSIQMKKYPRYMVGPAYMMGRDAVSKIYNEAVKMPPFPFEDVFLAGFIPNKIGLAKKSSKLWMNERETHKGISCMKINAISLHNLNLPEMRRMWKAIHRHSKCYRMRPQFRDNPSNF